MSKYSQTRRRANLPSTLAVAFYPAAVLDATWIVDGWHLSWEDQGAGPVMWVLQRRDDDGDWVQIDYLEGYIYEFDDMDHIPTGPVKLEWRIAGEVTEGLGAWSNVVERTGSEPE